MKIQFNIMSKMIVLLLIITTSCSLEEDPKFRLSSKNVFKNESSAEAVIVQNYGWLGHQALYGQYLHEMTIANGVYWAKTDGDRFQKSVMFDNFQEHPQLNAMWLGFYRVISEGTYLAKGLEESNLPQTFKTLGIAHASFLRGFAYFQLANLFGKAVIITQPIASTNLNTPLSSRNQVYEQVLKDLIFATENLPTTTSMKGFATKDAANAFVAKCYWMMANHAQTEGKDATELYTLAKKYGDKAIGKFALESQFANLWSTHTNSSESIFQINFTDAIGINLRTTFNFGPTSGQFGRISAVQPSFGNIKFDRAFYDFHRGTYPDDPRMASTYLSRWVDKSNAQNRNYFAYPLFNTGTPIVPVVYDMYNTAPRNTGNAETNPNYNFTAVANMPNGLRTLWSNTGIGDRNLHPLNNKMLSTVIVNAQYDPKNLIVFRYADLLLLMADVENELGNSGQALNYLNQVLNRARTSAIGAVHPKAQTALSKVAMREKIFFERMFELAGEPNLFEDVRRRGTPYLKKVIELHNNSKSVQYRAQFEINNSIGGLFRDYFINNNNITEDFLKKNLLLPIPLDEINNNEKVYPEDQNFGY